MKKKKKRPIKQPSWFLPKLSQLYRYVRWDLAKTARLSRRLFRRSELNCTVFNIRKWLDPSGEVHPQTWENIDMFLRLFCWLLFRVVSRAPTKKFLKILKYGKLFGVETSAHTLRGALFKSILDPRVILLYIYMLMCFNMRCTGKKPAQGAFESRK